MSLRLTSTRAKVLASGALIAAAAGAAGLATFGSFTSTTSASEKVTSGLVKIALGTDGSADNRLSVAANNIVPGDTIQRAVTLSNTGNTALSSITLTTTPTTAAGVTSSSLLDTDKVNGLQMKIEACSKAWTESGTGPYTYTCGGTTSTVLATTPVIGANLALSNLTSVAVNKSDYLRVTLSFPTGADNTFQGLTSNITFAFTGMQRTTGTDQ